ncbi:MAG: HDOD domain-containing protein [Phycisphaeraceae bacterium]|nr:HDOD domain-containing protein [Phycisphaeraceae bacterium]MBX3405403.1 HDOD domain-containing protein [Phycisphaeraceae bacterium]
MKPRRDLSAIEIEDLYETIGRRLERIGLETQPKVAIRVMELAQDAGSQLKDWAAAVQTDWALTGRLLRLANSAYYAQRAPVTRLERALVLLGTERTKAVCLGFYLSRAAALPGVNQLSREVWGQSVFRASLATAIARAQCPALSAEAFVVGLMLDCAVPVMARMLGEDYVRLVRACPSPAKLFATELDRLEFTHTDVAATLARRWKLPTVLARPIAWHHAPPTVAVRVDNVARMQRIAYYVGAVQLNAEGLPIVHAPLQTTAEKLFGIESSAVGRIVADAANDYRGALEVFSHLGDRVDHLDAITDSVQVQLIEMMDEQMERALKLETRGGSERMTVAGHHIEVEPGEDGAVIAYLAGQNGERLLSCTVRPERETADTIRRKLGLDDAPDGDLRQLMRVMQAMAA